MADRIRQRGTGARPKIYNVRGGDDRRGWGGRGDVGRGEIIYSQRGERNGLPRNSTRGRGSTHISKPGYGFYPGNFSFFHLVFRPERYHSYQKSSKI